MKPEDRRAYLVDIVREHGRVSVEMLAERLRISRETIRRDLTELSDRGLVRKYHGGAFAPEVAGEGAFQARLSQNMHKKRAIARRASAFFQSGDTLFIDTGSTTVFFAEELSPQSGITVITNSVSIASIMARGSDGTRVFMIGGEYRDDGAENIGALAVEQISRFSAQHVVLTVAALDQSGAMDFDLQEAEVARAMIERAKEVTIIVDSSKFDKTALFGVCPLTMIDRIVCEEPPSSRLADALRAASVEVIIAENGRP
jgi:DeoR/GlpR family transcriptional regulator of sugar metabolism